MPPHILAIAGGVGGAKLALGLSRLLRSDDLTIVVNTGDDEIFHGLYVSPDLDSVTYALGGLTNPETGWGIVGDTFRTLEALGRLGAETWFKLGDLDFATHIRRSELLRSGATLSEATHMITTGLNIAHHIAPMSDDAVRTVALTEEGELSFQSYFVKRRCEPRITGIRFDGTEAAVPSPAFSAALANADAIVFCPSNPLVSIGPVLALPGVRAAISKFQGPRIAVSPIIGGQAVRGPAGKMLSELGEEVSSLGVARRYVNLCDVMVIDTVDRQETLAIEALGIKALPTQTLMRAEQDKIRLAKEVMQLAGDGSGH